MQIDAVVAVSTAAVSHGRNCRSGLPSSFPDVDESVSAKSLERSQWSTVWDAQ